MEVFENKLQSVLDKSEEKVVVEIPHPDNIKAKKNVGDKKRAQEVLARRL